MIAAGTVDAGQDWAFSASASDPGILDVLTYSWDLDNDGQYDDAFGSSGSYTFDSAGQYQVGLRVTDGDGGIATGTLSVNVEWSPGEFAAIPEPATLAIFGFGLAGLGLVRRKRRAA
jgi:PKD domain/PEP-CTERM motif